VSSLTAFTSHELWGCSKVTVEGMRAPARTRTTHRSRFEQRNSQHHLQVRAEATVRCAELHVPWGARQEMPNFRGSFVEWAPCCVTRHPEPLGGWNTAHNSCVRGGARAQQQLALGLREPPQVQLGEVNTRLSEVNTRLRFNTRLSKVNTRPRFNTRLSTVNSHVDGVELALERRQHLLLGVRAS
jgi:hypothetical protein